MKRILPILLTLLCLLGTSACRSKPAAEPFTAPVRSYSYRDSEEIMPACVSLYEDNTFTFAFSTLSSYIGRGTYTVEDDVLTLYTYDGDFTYTFIMKDDTLIFDAERSSKTLWYSDLKDGAVLY